MRFIILCIFSLLSTGLYSQSPILDSLQRELAQTKEDTTRIRLLIESSVEQHLYNPGQARFFIQGAKKHMSSLISLQEKALALQYIGIGYYNLEQLDTAVIYFEQAERQVLQMTAEEEAAESFFQMGLVYDKYGYLTPAFQVFEQSLVIYQKLEKQHKAAILLEKLAKIYEEIADYPKALDYLRESLKIRKQLPDELLVAHTLLKVGQNLEQQQSYEYALSYFFQAKSIYQRIEHKEKLPNLYLHLGKAKRQLNQLDSAHFYLQQALALSRPSVGIPLQTSMLLELGQLYEEEGQLAMAEATLKRAFSQADTHNLIIAKCKIAEALYRILKRLQKTQEALFYNDTYQHIKDSLLAMENHMNLLRLEADYEFEKELQQFGHGEEKKAIERNEQLKRAKFIRYIIITGFVAILIILLILYQHYQFKHHSNKTLLKLNRQLSQQSNILQLRNQQLQELDQTKSNFFTNISHEFRTPLTIIDGMVQQIKKAPEIWTIKGLQMIERNNANLLQLIDQILNLRKLRSGKLELHLEQGEVISYIAKVFESFRLLGDEKGVKLHFLSQEKQLMMYYDEEKLLRLLSNLLSNAIKFTPTGGNVYLFIAVQQTVDGFDTFPEPEGLEIRVKDTGIGISEQKLPFIFDRFYQVDNLESHTEEGTGIGLALSKELVKVMNGSIQVFSELERGTTFEVLLPVQMV